MIGHSYGTYIATMAAAKKPDLYSAYVGIGQMSDTINSELEASVAQGQSITPREYVRKYGFAARGIDEDAK